MCITVRDWTEFSNEVEEFKWNCKERGSEIYKRIHSKEDITSKDYPVQHWIDTADKIFEGGGWLIQDDIDKIKSSLYEFGVSITKAIDEYEELGMSEKEVDELVDKFKKYAKETNTRQMRLHCQE